MSSFYKCVKTSEWFKSGVLKSFWWQPTLNIRIFGFIFMVEMPFYAVAVGKIPGVYKTWEECQTQTKGFQKAKYRKFNTEAEASNFVKFKGSVNNDIFNLTPKPEKIENLKPPELKTVSENPSRSLLKQDRFSFIAKKLDSFIEETNKKLIDFGNRLDLLEASCFSGTTSKSKKRKDSSDIERSRSKKKKIVLDVEISDDDVDDNEVSTNIIVTRNKRHSKNETAEEVDGPWGNNSSSTKGFVVGPDGFVIVYTDGACSNNGKIGAKAGLGVWFNHNNPFNLAAPVAANATNNNAEIQAATRAIQQASLAGINRLNIHTDSQFMINCMTDWIKKWKKNNWMTGNGGPVKNKEQLVILDEAIQSIEAVKWTHVRGHMGNEGNECADALARSGATMY